MTRRMLGMLVFVVLVFGGIFGWKAYSGMQLGKSMQAMTRPPVTVSTADVRKEQWSPSIPAVGTLRSREGVDVTVQIAGLVTRLNFESGATVKAGDLLVQQYSADDEARLQGLVAETRLAELNLKRAQELLPKNMVSRFDYDAKETDLQLARAAEQNLRLTIAQKSIRAPFSGRLGIRQVDVGQYIEPGDTIVRLEALEEMLIDFPMPQRVLSQIFVGQPLHAVVDAWPNERFAGVIHAIGPQVSADTRSLRIQGQIDNPDGRLLPGMFARIEIALDTRDAVLTVPQAAISYSPYGNSVYVVQADTAAGDGAPVVENVFVVTGATRGDQVAIESGLSVGQTVVTAGQQKLTNGARVTVDNSVPVSNAAAPSAADN